MNGVMPESKLNKSLNKIAIILSSAALLVSLWVLSKSNDQVVYVDAIRSFESFELTSEVKTQKERVENSYSSQLDSLELAIKMLESTGTEKYQRMVYQYTELEKARNNNLTSIIEEGDQKIWDLLNGYYKEFGEENGCEVLLGGMGNGNILYVKEYVDLTDEFIVFANDKFNGE